MWQMAPIMVAWMAAVKRLQKCMVQKSESAMGQGKDGSVVDMKMLLCMTILLMLIGLIIQAQENSQPYAW